jgi:hypothetical protein
VVNAMRLATARADFNVVWEASLVSMSVQSTCVGGNVPHPHGSV